VHFGQTAAGTGPAYTVNFGASVTCKVAIVHRDNVTWNLNGATFTQAGFSGVDSLIVGAAFGENATLTIFNGTVSTLASTLVFSEIGKGIGATGAVTLGNGARWISSPALLIGKLGAGTLNVNAGAIATLSSVYVGGSTAVAGGMGVFDISGGTTSISGTLKIWNNGTLHWNGGALSAPTIALSGGGKAILSSGDDKVLRLSSISIDSAGGSKLDLADNAMVIDYTSSSPRASIQSLLNIGAAGGSWNGNGITSSSAAGAASTLHKTALGYAEASSIFASFPASFLGQSVDSTTVLVRYTLAGDSNLDGVVNAIDFGALSSNFGGVGKLWTQGDFNYDGAVNSADFNLVAANFATALASPAIETMALLPEPSMMLAMMVFWHFPRRRRFRL
jgi:T5SS/PEP-CTERM-associated repeat protein